MERINPLAADSAANWAANNGATRSGTDADGTVVTAQPALLTPGWRCPPARQRQVLRPRKPVRQNATLQKHTQVTLDVCRYRIHTQI